MDVDIMKSKTVLCPSLLLFLYIIYYYFEMKVVCSVLK